MLTEPKKYSGGTVSISVGLPADVAQRIFNNIGNSRVAFIEDEAWDKLGLPKEDK